ncbi:MAG: Na+/H+ antiporter NhaC [Woeseia sp.]|jgi:Na+:H+ antiporter, NhaC family|nr:Na+/H+ antiporter NhaC [Woeseia sp.]
MKKSIGLFEAMLPLVTMVVCLVGGSLFFPMSSELLVIVMLISAVVAGVIAIRHGHDWVDIQRSTGQKVASVLPALLILLSIGMLIGTWMFSGTIPMLVYYGIRLVNPDYMILTAFLVTAAMSLTGSSWASAGTVGVALMGVATAMGAPLAATAGAVVSGAYFGDKLSPLSDSTNICAIGAKADLYDHIRNMIYTAGPSFVVAFVVYLFASITIGGGDLTVAADSNRLLQEIDQIYVLNALTFLPAVVVLYGTFRRKPAALTMVASSLVAMIVGVGLHDLSVNSALLSAISGFSFTMVNPDILTDPSSALTSLLNRGGVNSMATTLILIIAAFLLAGGMDVSGGLNKLLQSMLQRARTAFGLVLATMLSGATMISLTSHGGVTALIVGGLFQDAYKDQGLAPENLSRSLEDSVTILEPLMPWTVSALFMATTLGVPTVEYAPWAIFCMTGPIFSILIAATYSKTGFGLRRLDEA